MNKDKQRIAIAGAMGATWQRLPGLATQVLSFNMHRTFGPMRWDLPNGDILAPDIGDYPADLNAMHEAEGVLTNDEKKRYVHEVQFVVNGVAGYDSEDDFYFIYATAEQRAKAFLRTIGKWEEGE